jgi:hypothetical protein
MNLGIQKMFKNVNLNICILFAVALVFLGSYYINCKVTENIRNYSPDVFQEIHNMRQKDLSNDCSSPGNMLKHWEKQFCLKDINPCYSNNGETPPFPKKDIGGPGCVAPYSKKCQEKSNNEQKEEFLDWSLYNPPISNGFTPNWWLGSGYTPRGANYAFPGLAYQNSLDRIYNPLRYPYRSEAFYEQGWYPNMTLPPQVIGCGGRRQGCLGGTQTGVPNVPPPIEISERNIAPVNITTRGPVGIPQQVGVLYKIFGSLNDVYPLYGRKKYPNSDTWEYYTLIGQNGNRVKARVLTKRTNNNELGTNDIVMIDGNSAKFRATIYESDFPQYIPYA